MRNIWQVLCLIALTCVLMGEVRAQQFDPKQIKAGALANGMTATTQNSADNSTKLATDAFVQSAVGPISSVSGPAILGNPNSGSAVATSIPATSDNLTALGIATGTAGSFVVNGGAAGQPSAIDLTHATNLPCSTGIASVGANVCDAIGNTLNGANGLLGYGASTVNNGIYSTNGSGAPGFSTTLPSGLTISNPIIGTTLTSLSPVTGLFNIPIGAVVSNLSDALAQSGTASAHIPTAFDVETNFGGSTVNGGRNGLASYLALTSATSATNPYRFYGAANFFGDALTNDNGTSGAPAGFMYGMGAVGRIQAGATHWAGVFGSELNVAADTGSATQDKAILSLNEWPEDAVSGALVDAALWINAANGAIGLTDGIKIDANAGQYPLKSSGIIMQSVGGTVFDGIDLSGTTITNAAFKSNGFSVDGSGNVIDQSTTILNTGALVFASASDFSVSASSSLFSINFNGSPVVNINSSGAIFTAGGYSASGSAGLTQTCTVNQAKTLIFTLGILTGGTCNS